MNKLLVIPNFKSYRNRDNEEGLYSLFLPYGVVKKSNEGLWSHFCTNKSFAMSDLKYPNRTKFLNEFFGEGNWEFEFYNFENMKDFEKYCESIAVECDLNKLTEQFLRYKKEDIHL